MIKVTINGIETEAAENQTILQIASDNGIEIPTLCHDERVKQYGACGLCIVEIEGMARLMRACSTTATNGMVINTESERVIKARKIALELLISDHVGDCVAPCSLNCPAGTDCQGYVKQIALGNDKEAVRIIKDKLPLPASIGRICPHPCEKECRRANVEEPISIAFLKAFAADNDLASGEPYMPECAPSTGRTVGIIGGGPAGLSAAYRLAVGGHKVTVYDAMPKMGGMLRYGIPEYRLPRAVLDSEIKLFEELGIELINNVKVGENITFDEIKEKHDAVLIAIGAWSSSSIRCKGEELEGVFGGIDFLREVNLGNKPNIGRNVAVVGGGNTAMDACRTAVRLGAENVYVIYRRTRAEMPAEDVEIKEAIEEGVTFKFLTNPAEIIGENGRVKAVKLQVMELGEPDASGRRAPIAVEGLFETIEVDSVISAIGQKVNVSGFEAVQLNSRGIIEADENSMKTNMEGVFAAGDAVNKGADIAIAAIAEANKAAIAIDGYLHGLEVSCRKPYLSVKKISKEMFADKQVIARAVMPERAAEERKNDFGAVYLGFSEAQARAEAARCLECGCHDYGECSLIRHANRYPIEPQRLEGEHHEAFKEKRLNVIERDQGKCILCGLCVRICEEKAKQGILGLVGRGFSTVIKPEFKDSEVIRICADCRLCADSCPTGALKIID